MIEVKMTLAEWREMLHPMTTEQIGNMSVTRPSGHFETHGATSYYIPEGYRFVGINALGEFEIKKIETPAMHGQTAEAQRDEAQNKLTAIRKIVNTSPIYSQREQHDKFEEIKKLLGIVPYAPPGI